MKLLCVNKIYSTTILYKSVRGSPLPRKQKTHKNARVGNPGHFDFGLLGFLDDLGLGSVFLYAFDSVEAARLGLVALAGGDDLAVAGLEPESVLAGLVGVDLVLRVLEGHVTLYGLILDVCVAALADAVDSVAAGGLAGIDLAYSDDLAV